MSYLRFCNSICLWEVSCLIYVSVTAFVCGRSRVLFTFLHLFVGGLVSYLRFCNSICLWEVSCLIYVSVTAFVCGRSRVLFTFL